MPGRFNPDPPPLTAARARLRDAAKAARMPLKEISLAIGRNHSYLQQYMTKGSPKVLPEAERESIAHLLRISPDELREFDRPLPAVAGSGGRGEAAARSAVRRLPLIIEGREREAAGAIGLTEMLGGDPAPEARVWRLSKAHGIFQPRTLLLIDPGASVRLGDFAALHEADTIRAIGLATHHPENRPAILTADGRTVDSDALTAGLWRIEAIRPA